jgi:hypothetical protein
MVKIVPTDRLASIEQELNEKIGQLTEPYRKELLNDDSCGRAFRYYLLFTHWPSLIDPVGTELSRLDIFYNRYHWFLTFAMMYPVKHGADAGLDQQAFQLLENATDEVDWLVIHQIETRVVGDVGIRES